MDRHAGPGDHAMTLSGTSSGATKVTWLNKTTGIGGTASGTDAWSVPDAALQLGENVIVVTNLDAAGQPQATAQLKATLEVGPSMPGTPVITALGDDPSGMAKFSVMWDAAVGAVAYDYAGAFNDGTKPFGGTATDPRLPALLLSYHAS